MGRLLMLVLVCLAACDDKGSAGDSGVDSGLDTIRDADSDGYTSDEDCDDTDPAVHPNADEICDDVDNDCDGLVDDADDVLADTGDLLTFYVDADGDGHGAGAAAGHGCVAPAGQSTLDDDCDDTDADVSPSAAEICDDVDNDCDDLVDDADDSVDLSTGVAVFGDGDGDGFGDDATAQQACAPAAGQVLKGGDCDDTSTQVYPGAREWCDGADNDCDPKTDEAGSASWLGADGYWQDWTTTLSPASGIASLLLEDAGTLYVCAGSWPVSLELVADVDLVGPAGASATVLSGGGEDRVLAVLADGVSVSVSGVTVTDGAGANSIDFPDGYGGGILCKADAALSLREVAVVGNTTGAGGGLMSIGCAVTVQDSVISDNTATDACGGACAFGGTLTLRDTTVSGNSANFAGGLMAYAYADERAELDIISTRVEDNRAIFAGGLYVYGGTARCTGDKGASNAGFFSNAATISGGAVYINSDTAVDSELASTLCDYGSSTGGDDNTPKDVYVGTLSYAYGDDETFSCTAAGCK